jgi:hypothetical protein
MFKRVWKYIVRLERITWAFILVNVHAFYWTGIKFSPYHRLLVVEQGLCLKSVPSLDFMVETHVIACSCGRVFFQRRPDSVNQVLDYFWVKRPVNVDLE